MDDRTKSFDYTRSVLHKYEDQFRAEIERLGPNPAMTKIVEMLRIPSS